MDYTELLPFAPEVGYLGLGLASFFGSLIPFVPIPSFLLLVTMAADPRFDIHILALMSALLATCAKQIIFYASYTSRRIMHKKTKKRMLPLQRLVRRYGGTAAFVAAATPIPDDLVYVPLGMAKYNPLKFFLATLSGKILLHYAIVLVTHYLGISLIESYLSEVDDPTYLYLGMVIFIAVMTALVILLLRLDWEKVLRRLAPWTLKDDE